MLWFIMNSGTSAPANEQQQRNMVHLPVGQRCQRIHSIAFSAVLHIDTTNLASSQMITCGKRYSTAFVGSDNIVTVVKMVGNIGTHILQQRVWNSREELHSFALKFFNKKLRCNHFFVPGMSVRISLMGMQ